MKTQTTKKLFAFIIILMFSVGIVNAQCPGNKVQMFNEGGEIDLFKKLEFNAVFYADVLSGSRMPNLIYMTSFENMAARDTHWKSFVDAPEWKRLSSLPEYQHNVSKADIILMHAAAYSDF